MRQVSVLQAARAIARKSLYSNEVTEYHLTVIRLAAIRKQKVNWGRPILGAFLSGWLSITFQPCAVAGEMEHDCPHCPPESAHEGHHGGEQPSADCSVADIVGLEARSQPAKWDDLSNLLPPFLPQKDSGFTDTTAAATYFLSARRHYPPGGPPLSILNCVFLK